MATCARDFDVNGYPVRNDLTTTNRNDMNMGIYYMVLEHDGKGQLTPLRGGVEEISL